MRGFITLYTLSVSFAALAAPVRRAASANTILGLQFAHVLEQLETQFYAQALKKFQSSDFTTAGFIDPQLVADQLTIIGGDEATHTVVLETALTSIGAKPISTCSFNFDSVLTDVKTTVNVARLVENLGVSAYLGAVTIIDDPELLTDAATILTVEARHQTIHNLLAGGTSISNAFDIALSPPQVLAIAGPFISGCDLGIPANPPLSVTNTDPVVVGSKLSFSSPALNDTILNSGKNVTCQMMVGGMTASISQPIDNCIVPDGIDGLVYVYVTMTEQPLLNDITVQFQADILAGPLGVFVDTKPNRLAQLISNSPIGGNPAFVSNGGSGGGGNSSAPAPPPTDSNPSEPSEPSDPSDPSTTTASASPTETGSTFTVTSTMPASVASSLIASLTASSSGLGPTTLPGTPLNAGAAPPDAGTGPGPNLATGDVGGANVIGWSSVPATPAPTASPARRSVPRRKASLRRL